MFAALFWLQIFVIRTWYLHFLKFCIRAVDDQLDLWVLFLPNFDCNPIICVSSFKYRYGLSEIIFELSSMLNSNVLMLISEFLLWIVASYETQNISHLNILSFASILPILVWNVLYFLEFLYHSSSRFLCNSTNLTFFFYVHLFLLHLWFYSNILDIQVFHCNMFLVKKSFICSNSSDNSQSFPFSASIISLSFSFSTN